jgi:stage II sporulation protein R
VVKRFSWNSYIYLFFAFLVLLVSWEHNRTLAAVLETEIPEESIRLRILAHSDSVQDQALKRRVRDAIVEQMNTWVSGPTTLEEARVIVMDRMPELESVVEREIKRYGFDYSYKVELGMVPFPAKMYGNQVYPAGDYEALRVTIGAGEGQNWWCVLFPPLCFVEAAKGEAVVKNPDDAKAAKDTDEQKDEDAKKTKSAKSSVKDNSKETSGSAKKVVSQSDSDSKKLEQMDEKQELPKKKVRFFVWEKVKSWFA